MLRIALTFLFIVLRYNLCTALIQEKEYGITPGKVGTNCSCGEANRDMSRIIGGSETGENEFPMMAGIVIKSFPYNGMFYTNFLTCGATLITHNHVLSACHCFYGQNDTLFKTDNVGIMLGAHDHTKFDFSKLVTAKKIILHKGYVNGVFPPKYDISIVVFSYVKFTDIIKPVCLPVEKFNPANKSLISLGWGDTTGNNTASDVLKKTVLDGKTGCNGPIKTICTYKLGTSQCNGDSGGPVMWVDPDTNRYTLVGVNSYVDSNNCTRDTLSSDVWAYMQFIQFNIAKTKPKAKTCGKIKPKKKIEIIQL